MLKILFKIFATLLPFCVRSVEISMQNRPQEPSLPYEYHSEEVSFQNKSDCVQLAGTLTLPKTTKGPFPAVILLHGSAPLDRDSSMFNHKLFLVWSDYLTKQGIAVLRFDKRSAGKSTGDYSTATLEDFANDALAGVDYLKTRKEIDPKRIGLVGHSEGGMTAVLASTKSEDVSFLVLMAAPCVLWEDLVLTQEIALQRADGVSEENIEKNHQMRKHVFSILEKEPDRKAAEVELRDYFSHLTLSEKGILEPYFGPLENQVQFFNAAWFRWNCHYDPANTLKKVKVPILALNGSKDLIVSPEQNLSRMIKTLQEINHPDFTAIELPNLNHAFQTCKTGSLLECGLIEETTAPIALSNMSEWILDRKCAH